MKYFSMFSGVGGFELGIGELGECVGVCEKDKYASQLLENKFGVKNYGDATKIKTDELPDFDFLCGGFPCQAFSIAGKREGFKDTRGTMFFEVARILKDKRPALVLLENVKGLLNHADGNTFKVIIRTLDELGYNVQWMVFNSKFFGVPQNRERVFIIGSLRGTPRPEILPFRKSSKEVPIKQLNNPKHSYHRCFGTDGVSPTMKAASGNKVPKIRSHSPRTNDPKKGGSGPLISDKHCFTLDRSPHYVNDIRKLTPLECERLQGFPEGWTEGFSDTQRYKMMGNAVTVNVIKAIVKRLLI